MSDSVQCGPVKVRRGDLITISMHHLCNNPAEWIEPERFIPERFEQDSPYFLTPDGNRRNPYSFTPFLGGSRICIGKTFIETISKLTLPVLLTHFKFDLPVGETADSFKYPSNNITCSEAPVVKLRISKKEPRPCSLPDGR